MSSMMNIGVSGLSAEATRLATISNNIANSDTTAYKSQDVLFAESYIVSGGETASGNVIQTGSGTTVSSTTTDWSTGAVNTTNSDTDIMISGSGFLPVALNGTTYYTRDGNFSLVKTGSSTDGSGNTVTTYVMEREDGSVLQGAVDSTDTTLTGAITFTTTSSSTSSGAITSITIDADGGVTAEPSSVVITNSQLVVQNFNNPDSLKQSENGLYSPTGETAYATTKPSIPGDDGTGTLTQGALEESNVDMATELTKLISAQRAYQANSKVITTADTLMETIMGMIR